MSHTYRVLFESHSTRPLPWPLCWELLRHDDVLDPLGAAAYRCSEEAWRQFEAATTPEQVLACAQHVWGAPTLPETLMRMGAFERYAPHIALEPASLDVGALGTHRAMWGWAGLLHAMHPTQAPPVGVDTLRIQAIQLSRGVQPPDPQDLVQAARIPLLCLRWLSEASGLEQGIGQDRIARACRRLVGVVGVWEESATMAAIAQDIVWRADVYARSTFEGPQPAQGEAAPTFVEQSYRVVLPQGWLTADLEGARLDSDAP